MTNDTPRPDPDALLARVHEEEGRSARGRLKIFLGMSAGVGKTYAMLQGAQERRALGLPVLVGWVETHGRAETEALLLGLERLPPRPVAYRGVTLSEFDLDGALARRPALILVDELAHTNAPGSRHAKRWQDVAELLQSGIDVWTTLNVQHLESLSDVVAQITGVPVRETLPDTFVRQADEIELIDLPPDELLQRLRDGKVYLPETAGRALEQFFRKGNLIALRELALRTTADRVDAQMQVWRRSEARETTWPVTERLVVSISSSPSAMQIVRAGSRMAARLRAEWTVVWVDTPRQQALPPADREYAPNALRLAESLGGETVRLDGHDPVEELLAYARRRNATRILVGKPGRFWWRDRLLGSFVDELVRRSGEIDVSVVSASAEPPPGAAPAPASPAVPPLGWRRYGGAAIAVALTTLAAHFASPFLPHSSIAMLYLLGVAAVAARWGRGPAALASLLGVAAFDFFHVPPFLTFAVADSEFIVTFVVMLVIGLLIGTLTARIRDQALAARRHEQEAVALYSLSRELAATGPAPELATAAARRIGALFERPAAIFLPDDDGRLALAEGTRDPALTSDDERAVATWAFQHAQRAGWGTDTLPGAAAVHLPLATARGAVGVLALLAPADRRPLRPDQVHLLEAFGNQLALALERERLAAEAERARLRAEAERLQSALLSSVSHDLRTPLASITGAASTLLEPDPALPPAARRELTEMIYDEAERLARLVGNLLDMTRLASDSLAPRREWQSLEEIVGAAIHRLGRRLDGRELQLDLPAELPLIAVDGVLFEQVLINLVENAVRYTPPGTPITIAARADGASLELSVADRGPGLEPGEEREIFEKFRRGAAGRETRGAGLGLAICRGIVEAHGGTIAAGNRPGGGALFRIRLPLEAPPRVP
ncbi:MAG: sensor histidine kinase KdpD [Acidobacteria bacterium]|jgi:two-component system sensor histidine kinase KdpD|nr:sensor histidine kinase KdpD [Acidobacteriota bacterium]